MHQDVIDKKLIVGERKIKDISMGARITSITSHMKILLQKKEIIQNITELHITVSGSDPVGHPRFQLMLGKLKSPTTTKFVKPVPEYLSRKYLKSAKNDSSSFGGL